MLIGRAHVRGGEASNGKSTFIKTLQNLLGSGNYSSLDIATLGQRFQAARIIGKLANLGDDIPNGFLRGDELSMFKKLVTGEQIYSDIKNSDGIEFRPNATMIFSMNSMPRLADTTDGVFRRLAFIPFRNRFEPGMPGYDPTIEHRMAMDENLQRLAVLGLMALPDLIRRGRLTEIPDMVQEVETVRINNDVVRRWMVAECIEESDIIDRWVSDVYAEFAKWARDAGENAVKQDEFRRRLLAVVADVETYETRDRAMNKRGQRFRKCETGHMA
jgi:putative DNA primase/helicase